MNWNEAIDLLVTSVFSQENSIEAASCEIYEESELINLNNAPYYSIYIKSCNSYIHLTSFWRAIVDNEIAFSVKDENQKFGRNQPLSPIEEYNKYFLREHIIQVKIKMDIKDLIVIFESNKRIELMADSCGYESWQIFSCNHHIICLGGGNDLAIF